MRFKKQYYRERKKEHHICIIVTWNVRILNREDKLENFKNEIQKNEVSVLGVSEVRWKGHGKIKSGNFTMYYFGSERAENNVAIVVHKIVVRSVLKKIAYNDRIIAVTLQAEPINILIM
jgi:nitrogen regulatory protein PII